MPLQPVALSIWYRVFGFSVFSTRSLSIVWGLVALVSWFIIVRSLFKRTWLAFLVLALLACDYIFIVCSASGRMDIMSATLGFAGFASYLALRERRLIWAILVSQSLIVMSGLTHPMGILPFFGLLFLSLYFDRKRIGLKHVAVALIPYVVGGAAWGSYILQDPSSFYSQFFANATMGGDENTGSRFVGLFSPFKGLKLELSQRYLANFGFGRRDTTSSHIKILFLVLYAVGVLGSLLIREIRRTANYTVLLAMTLIYFIGLTVIDSQKNYYYLVHIVPFYLTMCALFIAWCWARPKLIGKVAAVALSAIGLVEIAGLAYRIRRDNYRNSYQPAVAFLKQNATAQSSIATNPGVAFGLGFPENVFHDPLFGYNTKRKFDYIVVDPETAYAIDRSQERDALGKAMHDYTMQLLANEYSLVYDHGNYAIYARKSLPN
ncbi:MAG TPA: glycosyltransferase family 39 protein, partial [Pyrinomonadaceae bacterium]|nr:glycosyltransferase family 39 protein [Pyrinomonadaceae bacterium]